MFEEKENFESNTTQLTNIETQDIIDTPQTPELTTTPQRDEVITPENSSENITNTGVSTYISVPDITQEKQICNLKMLTPWDKINMWTVFLFVVITLIFFGKESFINLTKKITKYIRKFSFLINLIFISLFTAIFLYPQSFNSGISGDINLFTMFEFALTIILNSALTMYIITKYLKGKNVILKDNQVSFSGISFLKKSMWTFTLTSLLFFFFTEAKIAFIILYIVSSLTSLVIFNQFDFTKLKSLKIFSALMLSLQLFLIGSLVGIFSILLLGTILSGIYLSDFSENKKLLKILKNFI